MASEMTRSAAEFRIEPPPARVMVLVRLRPLRSTVPPAMAIVPVPSAPASVMLTTPPARTLNVPAKAVGLESVRPGVERLTKPVPVRPA